MKTLLSIIFVFCLLSCDDNQVDCCVPLPPENDDSFWFSLKNSQGDDLLNPDMEGSYNTSRIRIYYFENGSYIEKYNPNSNHPWGYEIAKYNGLYRIIPLFDTNKGVIRWNESESDTISRELTDYEGTDWPWITKIWYNGELVWDIDTASNRGERYFEIVKQGSEQ